MKRFTLAIALLLAGIALTGSAAWAQGSPAGAPPSDPLVSECPVVSVSAIGAPEVSAQRVFSARELSDLSFELIFRAPLDRERVVTLRLLSPAGHHYRSLEVPVATPRGEAALGSRHMEGYPYPVPVRSAAPRTVDGTPYWIAEVRLPVAGSTIVTSGLYGRWRVETWLDGASRPCPGGKVFVISE